MTLNKNLLQSIQNRASLQPGEGYPVLLALIQSLMYGIIVSLFYISSTTLFLKHFATELLPYAYIASAPLIYGQLRLNAWIHRKFTHTKALTLSSLLVTGVLLVFIFGSRGMLGTWAYFLMFLCHRPLVSACFTFFWGVQNNQFNIRQGKRLFGIISSGEVIASIIGYFGSRFILQYIELYHLVTICFFASIVWTLTVQFSLKRAQHKGSIKEKSKSITAQEISWKGILYNPYYCTILALTFAPILSIFIVQFVFLQEVTIFHEENIASFLCIIFGISRILELLVKLFLAGQLLSKQQLRVAISLLPSSLFLFALFAAFSLFPLNNTLLFFIAIVLCRVSILALRGGINVPVLQILQQPIDKSIRFNFQSKVTGLSRSGATLIAGFIILSLVNLDTHHIRFFITGFLLVIIILWIAITFRSIALYGKKLKSVLLEEAGEEKRNLIENEYKQLIKKTQKGSIKKRLASAADLIDRFPLKSNQFLFTWLHDTDPHITEEAYVLLKKLPRSLVLEWIKNIDVSNSLTPKEISIISSLQEELPIITAESEISKALQSNQSSERQRAALSLSTVIDTISAVEVFKALEDKDATLCRLTILAIALANAPQYWEKMLEPITNPKLQGTVFAACTIIGYPIIPKLASRALQIGNNSSAYKTIIDIYAYINGPIGTKQLWKTLRSTNYSFQQYCISKLSCLGIGREEKHRTILLRILRRTLEHMAWLMGSLRDLKDESHCRVVIDELGHNLDRAYMCAIDILSILYDNSLMRKIRSLLLNPEKNQGTNPQAGGSVYGPTTIYALELLDTMVDSDLRVQVVPFFEELSLTKRLEKVAPYFPQQKLSVCDRLIAILHYDYSLLTIPDKIEALQLLTVLFPMKAHRQLRAALYHTHPDMRSAAIEQIKLIDQKE